MAMTAMPRTGSPVRRFEVPWTDSFTVDGVDGGAISLSQRDGGTFELHSAIRYTGLTGLEDENIDADVLERIRVLAPTKDRPIYTDLASVPGPARWFVGTYGEHTPAVIIHDELIPARDDLPGVTEVHADRYLRFMLQDVGVRFLKRWIMWSAVAMRSRWVASAWKRALVIVWLLAAAAGMTTFVLAAADGDIIRMAAALAAPAIFAFLWGKQYGAGLIAAVAAPWLLPPTVLSIAGYLIYRGLELAIGTVLSEQRRGTGTVDPEGF